MYKFTHKHALRVLLVTSMVVLFAGYMFTPIYAIFVEKIGGDILDAGLASMIFGLVAGLVTFLSGKYVDNIEEKEYILIIGYFITAGGFWLMLFVKDMWGLAFAQVVLGLGEAIAWPAFDALYTYHTNKNNAGNSWGTWESMNYIVSATGAALGAILVKFFGFKVLFMLMGSLTFLSGVYILFLDRREL